MRPASALRGIVAALVLAIGLVAWFALDEAGETPRVTTSPAPAAAVADAPATPARASPSVARATIVGRVRHGGHGGAVAGARVVAQSADGKSAAAESVSDAAGAFRLERVAPETALRISASREGFAGHEVTDVRLAPGETRDVGVLLLWESATLTVRVLGPDGAPVEGAAVRCVGSPWELLGAPRDFGGTTGADGLWTARDLAPASVVLRADKQGFAPAAREDPVALLAGDDQTVTLRLLRAWTVTGRVCDPAGQPMHGVLVAPDQDGRSARLWESRGDAVTTDAEGRYRLTDVAAGRLTLHAGWTVSQLHAVASFRVPTILEYDFVLRRGGTVSGRVTDETGAPIAGAYVWGGGRTRGGPAFANARTSEDGRYAMRLFECIGATVSASAPGYAPLRRTGGAGPAFDVRPGGSVVRDVTLRRGARVWGVVSDAAGPLPGARVTVFGGGAQEEAMTDVRGRYELLAAPVGRVLVLARKEGWLLEEAPADPLAALAAGTAPAALCADVPKDGEARVDVLLGRGRSASGRVESAVDGSPLPGIRVRWSDGGRAHGSAKSAVDGTFRFTGVPPGREVYVSIDATWGQSIAGPQPRFTAQPHSDVTGLVVRCTLPQFPELTVSGRVRDASGSSPPGLVLELLNLERVVARATPSADGEFTMSVAPWTQITNVALRASATERTAATSVSVVVPRGQATAQVDLLLPAGLALSGRVLDRGAPAEAARVVLRRADSGMPDLTYGASLSGLELAALTDDGGSFTVQGLEPGDYDVAALLDGSALAFTRVRLPRSDVLILEVPQAADLVGFVNDGTGQPVCDVEVVAQFVDRAVGVGSFWPDRALTDADGAFRIRERPLRAHRLTVSSWFSGPSILTASAGPVMPGGDPVRIIVQVAPGIAGRVVDADGAPLRGLSILAVPTDPPVGRSAVGWTALDGTFRLTGLSEGLFHVEASRADDILPGGKRTIAARNGIRAGEAAVELVARSTESIAGTLRYADGQPAPRHWVLALPAAPETARTSHRTPAGAARTDSDGRFRIDGLPTGRFRLCATEGDDPLKRLSLTGGEDVASGASGVALVLPRHFVLVGRVRDRDGTIVRVTQLRFRHEESGIEIEAATDASGAFRAEGLVAGRWSATAGLGEFGAKFRQCKLGDVQADAGDVELRPID